MNLQKPFNISLRGKTIDGNEANEVTWKVSGDIQTAYKIDILSNADSSIIWTSNKITSYSLKHTIPPSVLENGNEYKIHITIWNQANSSITSDAEIFQTSSRPIVTVINAVGTVNSFSYNFQATYTQNQSVPVSNYVAYLYNDKQELIDKSNIKTILPMEHLFSNLQPETTYFIEFHATSQKGLVGTSGKVLFDVFYLRPKMNVNLQGKNIDNAGIELSWYVTQIILNNNGGTFVDNEKIDVRTGNVIGNEGFEITQDFSLKFWIEQPYMSNVSEQVDLIRLNGTNGDIRIQYWNDNKFHVWKNVNGLKSHWASDEVIGDSFVVLAQQIMSDINISSEVIA